MNTEPKYEIQYVDCNEEWHKWPEWQTYTDKESFTKRLKELRELQIYQFRLVKKEIKEEILDA